MERKRKSRCTTREITATSEEMEKQSERDENEGRRYAGINIKQNMR
jgi:hypothetical protein